MDEFVFSSEAMMSVMEVVHQVAKYDVNVLIEGESGTGKEMLAKIIHLQSPRAENPFVPVNCGVLSGLMFEDKLFGHEKGAFTGAIDQKKGCFELAHGGTLFLDEISELKQENQVDFLRILEDFKFMRIGGNETIEVDVRIVSATNRDLKQLISQNLFREDLFYRLQVIPISLPPLRNRKKVIPKMVDHFMNQFEMTYKKQKPEIHPDVIDLFLRYNWPGNVRELRNLIERIFIICSEPTLREENLPPDFLAHFEESPQATSLAEIRRAAEEKAIMEALARAGDDRTKAADILKISPRTLRHKLQVFNIESGEEAPEP
jgi:two-component system, NtrC family, response regulator AtoC